MKFSTIVIVALVATSVLAVAGAENCKDHPWAKRGLVDKILSKKLFDGWEDADGHVALLTTTFGTAATAKDTATLTTAAYPMVPADWITSDVTTCCTTEVYTAIKAVPAMIISMVQNRPSKFERILGAFAKVIKKCGRKVKKAKSSGSGSGSESKSAEATSAARFLATEEEATTENAMPDLEKMTLRAFLKRLPARKVSADETLVVDSSIVPSDSSTT
jgi:hypothetical protein